jgi:outer membrane protein assembly factor BamB
MMIKRNSVFLAVLCLSGATTTLAFTTGSDRPAEVRPGQSGTLPPPNTSSPETTLGTLETGEATLEDDWFNTVLQKLPTVDDSARREIVLNRDKNGCYLPQNMLGAPSKKAPTVPPPPSTAPPQDKPSGTIEYGEDCGAGSMKWRFKTGNIVSSSASFSSDGSVMYIGSRDGSLYALRTSDGKLVWKTPSEHAVDVIPAVSDNMVVYGSSSARLTAVNPIDAKPIWSFNAKDGVFQSSPLIVGDRVFSGGGGHFVRSFEKATGKLVWERELGMWVQSSVAHRNGVIYIGSDAGFLVAYDASSGREMWKFAARMPGEPDEELAAASDPKITPDGHRSNILSTPRFQDNLVFITSIAGMIYAVNADTGKEVWSFLGERIVTDTKVSNGVLYTHSDLGVLRAFDARTGRVLWGARTGTAQNYWPGPYQTASAPDVYSNQVIVGGTDGDVSSYDSTTGAVKWSFRTGDWVMSSPRVSGDTVFVGSNDGWIYAINLA